MRTSLRGDEDFSLASVGVQSVVHRNLPPSTLYEWALKVLLSIRLIFIELYCKMEMYRKKGPTSQLQVVMIMHVLSSIPSSRSVIVAHPEKKHPRIM